MTRETAQRWVTVSALIVAGIYAYRRLTEAAAPPVTLKKLVGIGELPPLGSFATAWGFTFLVVAIMTEASPGLGGGFAILIATSDFLTNSGSIFADIGKQTKQTGATTTAATATGTGQQANVIAGGAHTPAVKSGVASVVGATATGIGQIGSQVIP